MENVEYYFDPESIAVVGASSDPDAPGYTLLKNARDSFDGDVYPVTSDAEEILGLDCYESVTDLPDGVDLVSILLPAPAVPDVVRDCVDKGAKAIFVGSEGFADTDEEGARRQEAIVEIAREEGARVWGPNCGGYLSSDPDISNNFIMDTEGHIDEHLGGNVSFIAQTGLIAGGIYVEIISEDLLEISKTLTIGNRADVAEPDLLEFLQGDEGTDVIGIYQESVTDGQRFKSALESTCRDTPVVILKGGRSEMGATAAKSHTGSIAGDDRVADAIYRQFGATRVDDFRQLLDVTKGFSMYPEGMDGDRVAVLTMTGAGSVVASDLFEDHGLELADLDPETIERLGEVYPDWQRPRNPVDIWLSITQRGIDETLTHCLETLLADDSVDGVLLQALAFDYFEAFDFDGFLDISDDYDKPVVTWLVGHGDHTPYWVDSLEAGGVPVYRDLSACARFMGEASDYARWRAEHGGRAVETTPPEPPAAADRVLSEVREEGRTTLTEAEGKTLLESWGVPVTEERVAADADAAVAAAEAIGYPVALKVSSTDILHKSDVGGLELDLGTGAEVRAAYDAVVNSARDHHPEADVDGVLVQEMVSGGTELLVGVTDDPEFGPMVVFGLGGTFVEVLEDVALRAAPLSEAEARAMVEEIDGYPILEGVRGSNPADVDAVVDVLCSVSEMAVAMEGDLKELDVNPLVVFDEGEGAVAVDAVVELDG